MKLPQMKPKEVVKALKRLGFVPIRQKGSHLRLSDDEDHKVTVAMHNKPIPKGTLSSILRQADVSRQELAENL